MAAREATLRLPIRWRDIDALGHDNPAVYHELLEEGRWALFAPLIEAAGVFEFVLARVELDYRREVRRADGEVELLTRVERVGRSSVTVATVMTLLDGSVAAEGRSVLVAWDGERRRSRALTAVERAALEG